MDYDYQSLCTDCKKYTETRYDHSTGDVICMECGLVFEEHYIDEGREWRTFTDGDNDNDDPNRVGKVIDPLHEGVGLTTRINTSKKKRNSSGSTDKLDSSIGMGGWLQNGVVDYSDRALLDGYQQIDTMADRLGVFHVTKQSAQLLYKRILEQQDDSKRKKKLDATLAACLYIACAQDNVPRTIEEIYTVSNIGVTKTDIGKAKERIVKLLGLHQTTAAGRQPDVKVVRSRDLIRRFCNSFGMEHKMKEAAVQAAVKAEQFDIRRTPKSISAALIFIMLKLSGQKITLRDVSSATGASQPIIRKTYKDLYHHITKIFPTQYIHEANLMQLPRV